MTDEHDMEAAPADETSDAGAADTSFVSDVKTLFEDGRTYAEAEIAFQRTRFAYVASHAKSVALFGGIAASLLVLAVFALVFGAILALTPEIGAWAATGVVAGILLGAAVILLLVVRARLKGMKEAFRERGK